MTLMQLSCNLTHGRIKAFQEAKFSPVVNGVQRRHVQPFARLTPKTGTVQKSPIVRDRPPRLLCRAHPRAIRRPLVLQPSGPDWHRLLVKTRMQRPRFRRNLHAPPSVPLPH